MLKLINKTENYFEKLTAKTNKIQPRNKSTTTKKTKMTIKMSKKMKSGQNGRTKVTKSGQKTKCKQKDTVSIM